MSVQIDQIFTAKAENVWQFLHAAGQGCYIPAYQRPYAWDDRNVDRLVEDVINGLGHLVDRSSAISFLGTIIAIHDTNLVTVKPVFQAEVAQRVMTLIDGQQRVSTSVMMNLALHHHIATLMRKLGSVAGEEFDWLREQAEIALAELWTTFALDQTTGNPPVNRYYPRVIRAFDDVWSKKGSQALYRSPIARLIWTYIQHVEGGATEAFNYRVVDDAGVADPRHEPIVAIFRYMRGELNALTGKKVAQYDYPDLQQVVRNDGFMRALWSYTPPEYIVRFVTEQSDHKQYDLFCALLRSLIFHKYFNTRMALTIVTTRSEDDAFDMFEALNTTGEPLTAFETFKPKVIEAEGLEHYQGSSSFQSVQRIEEYLDAFRKADDRQRATSELLIPFALGETGERLQKNLSDQRRYLRDYFDKLPTIEDKRGAVGSLANLTDLVRTGWSGQDDDPKLEGVGKFDEETGFCFQALRALKHSITVGPLSRFYDEMRSSDDAVRPQRRTDLLEAIRASTAFSMLWRGALGGTENIDAVYRGIMAVGSPTDAILPLAKRTKDGLGAVSLSGFKRVLWTKLTERFPDRDAWVKAAARTPIYGHSATVAKFLLLVASDDAAPDPGADGLIVRGKKGLAPTVQTSAWRADAHFSVEHVAPQSSKHVGWADSLYEDPQTIQRLGNLLLLPRIENSNVGDRPWVEKRLIYRHLSAETTADADAVEAEAAAAGVALATGADTVLGKASYMPMCKSVGRHAVDWSVDVIDDRSTRLAELAYDRMVGWLKP
jgi:hypothetical protein